MVKRSHRLTLVDVFCLGLNAIIGSGIFLFPGTLAALVGPSSIFAFGTCGLLLTAVALCYGELGSMLPGNGGSALYAREAYGEDIGFGVGLIAWAAAILSWSAVASILASHLSYFSPVFEGPYARKSVAAGGVLVFGAVNYRGIKGGAWTVDLLTSAKVIPLALFVLTGLSSIETSNYTPFFAGEQKFGRAVFLALWALQGFEVAPVPAGETDDPQRDVPRGVIGSLLSATVFYMLIQCVAVGTFPGLAAGGQRPLVDAAYYTMGSWGARLLAAGGIISMLGFIAGAALGAPRYLSSLGEGSFKRWELDRVHPGFQTPHRAIAVTTGAAVALILLFDFSKLIDLSNLAVVSQYFSSCLAVCVLRVHRPRAQRPFRVPYLGFVAVVGAGVSVWLMTMVSAAELVGCSAVLAGGYAVRHFGDRR